MIRPLLRATLLVSFLGACHRPAPAAQAALPTAAPGARVAGAVFRDSALFRALCLEADTMRTLATLPTRCTPRDQGRDPIRQPRQP